MSVKYTTPAQHKSNLRNVYGTFAIEGMTISKDTRSNLDRIGSGQGVVKRCHDVFIAYGLSFLIALHYVLVYFYSGGMRERIRNLCHKDNFVFLH